MHKRKADAAKLGTYLHSDWKPLHCGFLRQQRAESLARYMTQLGLEKKVKLVPALSDYLAKKQLSQQ